MGVVPDMKLKLDGETITITEAQLIRPGDVLIIQLAGRVTEEQAERVRARVRAQMPDLPVLIVDSSPTFQLYRLEEIA